MIGKLIQALRDDIAEKERQQNEEQDAKLREELLREFQRDRIEIFPEARFSEDCCAR
ncbi:hypothetical protein ACT3TB_16385 [Micrococcaceae sp. AOP34-BR2-30]